MAYKSFAIPTCRVHRTNKHMRRDPETNKWFCLECADEFLKVELSRRRRESLGGIVLPSGVEDPRVERASFKDVYPNRAARRAAKRAKVVHVG